MAQAEAAQSSKRNALTGFGQAFSIGDNVIANRGRREVRGGLQLVDDGASAVCSESTGRI
jgi:hypothetical protein